MRNKHIPYQWNVNQLVLVNYHRYTSHPTDIFIEVNHNDEKDESCDLTRMWFNALKERVMNSYIDTRDTKSDFKQPDDCVRTRQWDNKVVIECLTPNSGRIFVGFYDWTFAIGLGVRSDSWINPYPFVTKPQDHGNKV